MICERCEFRIGDVINQKYVVDAILGDGSFGTVYKVKDQAGYSYAFKLLKLWEVPSGIRESLILRFEMEFQTGQINSHYLVRSLDYGQISGNPYILMEYCPGGDLGQYIGLSHPELPRVCRDILSGLHDLHLNGKVHRDLKPENVLFKEDGTAALTDFGIAGDRTKRMTERNIFGKPQQLFGTYAYMPPEQVNRARGEATVLPTTDIFSFGVLLYQLLTGELPFGTLNEPGELAEYQDNAKRENWNRRLLSAIPDGQRWEALISGCLVSDFRYRLQSAKDALYLLPEGMNDISPFQQPDHTYVSQNGNGMLLKVMQGEEYGRVYELSDLFNHGIRLITLGREAENVLCIKEMQSAYISRYHCTIETDKEGFRWFIRDGQWDVNRQVWNNSTNGTYVNSTWVTSDGVEFKSGDIISVGDVKLRFESY